MKAVKMIIHAITLDPDSNSPILILKEEHGDRTLPIWIGLLEATAIATEMEKLQFARPMTHDLAINLLKAAGVNLIRIDVTELKDNTYYAEITIESGGNITKVDSRPSDAINLAVRANKPIFVKKEVIEKAKSNGAKLVIGEPFSDKRVVKTIAREIGGKVLIINPIPDKDYVVSLAEWGEKICSALKE